MPEPTPPPGMNLGDIYFILFRRKWIILTCVFVGLLIGAVVFFTGTAMYRSEAKVLVRYILDTRSVESLGSGSQMKSPDSQGANIINSEIEILTSADLALEVADLVGPERILARAGGGASRFAAAGTILGGLKVDVPQFSNVIRVRLNHPDPAMVQLILDQLIDSYFRKHTEVHRSLGSLDAFLTTQTDSLRISLSRTEEELRKLKSDAGVINLEESKKALAQESAKIRADMLNAEAELGERMAALRELEKLRTGAAEGEAGDSGIPAARLEEYRRLSISLDRLQQRELELLGQLTGENPVVAGIREQIADHLKRKEQLELEHRGLAALRPALSTQMSELTDPAIAAARIAALQARMEVLSSQMQRVRTNVANLEAAETQIVQMQRKKDLEESKYRNYEASLYQAHIDQTLGAGRLFNLSKVQAPSAPGRNNEDRFKNVGLIIAAGILVGIALAFLLELFVDPTLKRSAEVERQLHLPLFLAIPESDDGRPKRRRLPWKSRRRELDDSELAAHPEIAPWDAGHKLRLYSEALRDRLVMYFERKNMTHRPKLVGITSSGVGAGVSTIACGLAAALSENEHGNVLLVDMNLGQEAAHPFFDGKPSCGLFDVCEQDKKNSAKVQENLFLASAANGNGHHSTISTREFSELMPKLKASDYDYIIFDLPPITQTSVTMRIAGFLDKVLYVVEAEKSHRDAVKRGAALLQESQPRLSVIFNKSRNYLPGWLHQEV